MLGVRAHYDFVVFLSQLYCFFWQSLFELPREITQGRRGLQQKRHKSAYLVECAYLMFVFFFLVFLFLFLMHNNDVK